MKTATAIGLFLIVPLYIAFTMATRGEYMPSIASPRPQLWNIQYLPLILVSLAAAFVSIVLWRRWRPAAAIVAAAIWNSAWCGLGLFAIAGLWGEKY